MSVNVKLGNNTINNVDSVKLKSANTNDYVEFTPKQELVWYKNALSYNYYRLTSSNLILGLRKWTISGTKVKSCYVLCKIDVTNCDVLIFGRKMQNGEGVSGCGDFTNWYNGYEVANAAQGNIYSYYQAWTGGTSVERPWWYLENNTLYLLSYSNYIRVVWENNSNPLSYGGIVIICNSGTPTLTNGSISYANQTISGTMLSLANSVSNSYLIRLNQDNYRTMLPDGLEGKTAIFGVKIPTPSSTTFELITTVLTK